MPPASSTGTTTAVAPGKLVLIGEYAVLEGAPALVAAVQASARVRAAPRPRGVLLSAPQLGVRAVELAPGQPPRPGLRVVQGVLDGVSARALARGEPPPSVELTIDTAAFQRDGLKLGLGSSAAVTVALWGALEGDALADEAGRRARFADLRAVHRAAQGGIGSGVDVAASLFGGLLVYQVDQPAARRLPLAILDDLELVPVWVGRSAATGPLVDRVLEGARRTPVRRALDELASLSSRACQAAGAGDSEALLSCIGPYHNALARLGELSGAPIVTDEHARAARVAREAGAVYKPSGAGGGDVGLVFCRGPEVRDRVRRAMRTAGLVPLELGLEPGGLRVGAD